MAMTGRKGKKEGTLQGSQGRKEREGRSASLCSILIQPISILWDREKKGGREEEAQ